MADTRKDVLTKQFDNSDMSDEDRMNELRKKSMQAMYELNKADPSHGAQTFKRVGDKVYLFNDDGTVQNKPATYNEKSGMYVSPKAPVTPPAR